MLGWMVGIDVYGLTTSTPPAVDNGEILSILVKNSISLFLSLLFGIIMFSHIPELTSNEDSTAAHRFSKGLHPLFQTRRLT